MRAKSGRSAAIIALIATTFMTRPVEATDASKPATPDELTLMPGDLLGKRLFEDTTLSEPRGLACASCHDARAAYQGNNHSPVPALALGSRPGGSPVSAPPEPGSDDAPSPDDGLLVDALAEDVLLQDELPQD